MGIPAVILKSKFVLPNSTEYDQYVDYIDRDDAKVSVDVDLKSDEVSEFHLFHSFMDYMDDDEKHGELFTESKDSFSEQEKRNLKKQFQLAQVNGSCMWQDVISFDNDWLEKQGLYNAKDHTLDEEKLRDVVRGVMNTMKKSEKMDNALWSASVHYNTDNIHIHVATVEVNPTRDRGKRKQGTLDKMKSRVVNQILDRSNEYNKIDDLIRGTVHFKDEKGISFAVDERTSELFKEAMELLPRDMSQWRYGYHSIDKARPVIDEIVDIYLETYHKEDMSKLHKKLDKQVEISRELYGGNSRYEQYKETKIDDLKKRMGNAVLTEMRNHVHDQRASWQGKRRRGRRGWSRSSRRRNEHRFTSWKKSGELYFAVMRLNYALKKKHHDYERERNIEEFDRMMEGYEYE